MPSERTDVHPPQADEFASPDLELLAEQLTADAAYLAGLYPARQRPPRAIVRRRRALPLRWSRAAAATIAVACGWWGFTGPYDWSEDAGPGRAPLNRWTTQPLPAAAPMMPAAFFFELTAPEKEAVLDLFEERVLVQASLSI